MPSCSSALAVFGSIGSLTATKACGSVIALVKAERGAEFLRTGFNHITYGQVTYPQVKARTISVARALIILRCGGYTQDGIQPATQEFAKVKS